MLGRKRYNDDEARIYALSNTISGVDARYATREEDYGHRRADIVLTYQRHLIYL